MWLYILFLLCTWNRKRSCLHTILLWHANHSPELVLHCFYLFSFCREDRGVEESCAQLHSVQWWRQRRWQWDTGSPHLELFSQRRKPGAAAVQLGNGLHRDGHGLLHRVSVCGRQRRDLDFTNCTRAAAVLINFRSPSGLQPIHK